MRQAFAACVAFAILVVVVVARCGFRDPSPAAPLADAGRPDAPAIDAAVPIDAAAPPPRKATPKPAPRPKPAKPTPTPKPTPKPTATPPIPPPVVTPPIPARPGCSPAPNPAGCPKAEPNINRPCDAEGVHCVYGTSCCPPVYVCNGGVFEAWFTHCD